MKKKIRLIYRMLRILTCVAIMIIACNPKGLARSADSYASTSRLSQGKWVKIKVGESGIYSISRSDLSRWGLGEISKAKVYGYGGAPISEVLDANQKDDLQQIPVMVTNDRLYFYGQGPTTWKSMTKNITYKQVQHPYATAGYYFVTNEGEEEQKALEKIPAAAGDGSQAFNEFTDRIFYEKELVSLGETGHYLLGEDFKYNTNRSFKFTLTDYVVGGKVDVLTGFAAKTIGGGSSVLTFQYNGTNLPKSSSDNLAPASSVEYTIATTTESAKSFELSGEDLTYTINFAYSGTLYAANLDYITINYPRKLRLNKGRLSFNISRSVKSGDVWKLENATEKTHVWDVSDTSNPQEIEGTYSGGNYVFSEKQDRTSGEYIAFDEGSSVGTPEYVGDVKNQNIHGMETPDMIIITPNEYQAQAQRIADLHADVDTMRVMVIDQETVFNEFSSGTPDIMAIRKMCKMFYDRGADATGHKLGYLLMFGRGTYDNRQVTATVKSQNFPKLLIWQSASGLDQVRSYSTDDILAMLDDGSGGSGTISSDILSIAVGRMPVKSVEEAKIVVDKLYNYVKKSDFGAWKNNALIIADDENNGIHMEQAENVIKANKENGGEGYVYNRLYLDSFVEQSTGSGRTYPDARKMLFQKLDEGVLYLDYIGHSNGVSWTHDGLLNHTDINNLYLKHVPLMYTASCEFTRHDGNAQSGGETFFLNGRGGAIALISAARQVTINDNGTLNTNVARYTFCRDKDGQYYRVGDILRMGKNRVTTLDKGLKVSNDNKLRYFLIGDPAMRLAYPTYTVKLESINGQKVDSDNMPTFKARQTIEVKGSIYAPDGTKATDFNGSVIPTLYDAEESVETHGYGQGKKYVYQDRANKLAVAKDTVSNGEFSVKMVIPAETASHTQYENYSQAMLNFYANSNDKREANGSNEQFYIYGYEEEVTDDKGPEIDMLVLNTTTFNDGDRVNESPLVMARVSDESGLNFSTSGVGHQMTLLLDEKVMYSDVSTYYTPELSDKGGSGTINYPLTDLAEGEHSLRLKVWDTFGNSTSKTITFVVEKGLKPDLVDVYTTSNPAITEAQFYVKHNRPDAEITVTLSIYDLLGREVWSTKETGKSDMFTSFPITWNLGDKSGRRVPRGIYLYKAGVSTDGNHESTKAKKIAVGGE